MNLAGFTEPAPWTLWIGTIGRGSILLAGIAFLVAIALSFKAPTKDKPRRALFIFGSSLFGLAMGIKVVLAVTGQYHYQYVFNHSSRDLELAFKVASSWAGQEGSFLLWACCSALFACLALKFTGLYERWFTIVSSGFLAFLAGILSFESPFKLLEAINGRILTPPDGNGLTPALINYWIVIHPPIIFLGFGSLLVMYAWAMAAMATKNLDDWIVPVRPWAIVSTTLVGLGLCLGGFWAYEMLNWGGFWMWDPVENTSFVPWVAAAAFLHGCFIQAARKRGHFMNLVLAAIPFLSFCYGTFLTRSGFLGDTSVHSFANMDRNALWILVATGSTALLTFLGLWIVRLRQAKSILPEPILATPDTALNKSAGYTSAIWMLLFFGLVTGIGMSVPLIQSLTGQQPRMVQEQLYHFVLGWAFPPFMLGMALVPFTTWRGLTPKALLGKVNLALAASIFLAGLTLILVGNDNLVVAYDAERTVSMPWGGAVPATPWVIFLGWLCIFAVTSNVLRMASLWKTAKLSTGGLLTHIGFAAALFGLVISRGFQQKVQTIVHPDYPASVFGYQIAFIDKPYNFADRYNQIDLLMTGRGETYTARPGLYFTTGNDGTQQPQLWPYIKHSPFFDVIVILYPGDKNATGETTFAVDEERAFQDVLLTYKGLETEGEMGAPGATFRAVFDYATPTDAGTLRATMRIGEDQNFVFEDGILGSSYALRLNRIDAATKSATVTLMYQRDAYPLEIFFKPLTIFVWTGVALMTLGGGVSAFSRWRSAKPRKRDLAEPEGTEPESKKKEDAPEPVAQV